MVELNNSFAEEVWNDYQFAFGVVVKPNDEDLIAQQDLVEYLRELLS